jgi:cytochrome c-type biogenesis protein CcmH/NrfF
MKGKLGRDLGLSPEAGEAMVLDHIIPLALGGHPRQPSNLQLQDLAESRRKDRIEVKLQCLVCSGQMPLDEARAAIARDWQAAYHRFARVKCHRSTKAQEAVDSHKTDIEEP